ncbi:MAG: type II toxin-antitoxin system VapC family toxin [Clostridia bacterium]|nr:type II toxin-antitoxin system VapC family toxin [Clostridia bacterium]
MKYMLDTNILVYAKNKRPESVLKRLTSLDPADVCISSVTLAEMEYGVFKSLMPEQNQLALMLFLSGIQIEPFDSKAAFEYGKIRAALTKKGTPIGANDLLIAAHAKSLGLILVTNNTREFERVEGLRLENWV